MSLQERHSTSSAGSVVKTFHDGVSVKFETEESLGGQQVLTDSAVDCLVTVGAAWSHICEKKNWITEGWPPCGPQTRAGPEYSAIQIFVRIGF